MRNLLLVIALLLSACGGKSAPALGPQVWEDVQFVVETRPSPPTPGMTEFLVIATNRNHTQAHDLLVSLRVDDGGEWKQAIQDGFVGVYRRALPLRDVAHDVLYVQVHKKGGGDGYLQFPLAQALPDATITAH